ncbi:MAG: glycosyl hydrolase [Chryseosolibacter sp.]
MPARILIILFSVLSISAACQHNINTLDEGFRNPPENTKPWVYWYWIDENISKEGITKDLEAMARVGIGQALIGHVSPGSVRGETKILSKEWWDMVAFAVKEGGRLGVDIGFFNGPGWSQSGGPWIPLDQSMRHVASREIRVHGPATFNEKLPQPGPDFKQIAVQAFPVTRKISGSHGIQSVRSLPESKNVSHLVDGDTATHYFFPNDVGHEAFVLEFQCNEVAAVQSLKFAYLPVSFYADIQFQQADRNGQFHTVRKFTFDRRNINFQIGPKRFEPLSFAVPETSAKKFRLVFENVKTSHGAGFTEIELRSDAALDQHIDKQLGKMASDPLPLWDAYLWPDQPEPARASVITPEKIIDLTSNVDATGTLRWEIPPGEWVILNTGMMPTGAVNVPVPPEATGYECDKFLKQAVETHFNGFIGKFLQAHPEEERTALKTIVIDSYEVGSQNWSNDFAEIFQKRFGYDPVPWLPVFSGRIVKSANLSNRFLWDVRRLTADLIAENYVRPFRELANKNGLKLWVENYGHWGFPAEFLQYGGQADMISGEFWFENSIWHLGPLESRGASSAAHIYGKNQVFAEAFTAGFNFRQYPASMKSRGDRMFCEGINHFVLHLYIHQPWEDKVPGVTAWFGMSFQRNNTWFEQSKTWIDYLRRCHFLLQQGDPVTDVCYLIGEDAPKMTGALKPALPSGYDYDFINAEVLGQSDVSNGRIVLPNGKKYSLLVLPDQPTMTPELLGKIGQLIERGAKVYGPAPIRSPSMRGFPESDRQVMALSRKIWGPGAAATDSPYGKGHVYHALDFAEVLRHISLAPDVICADTGIVWTHRQAEGLDIYFISNQNDREVKTNISFRVANKIPERWEPDNGSIAQAASYRHEGERTVLPITLDPSGSVFIVFRRDGTRSEQTARKKDRVSDQATREIPLADTWQLHFPRGWDAPDSVHVNELISWTEFSQPGIKYFSGTASYKNTFVISEDHLKDSARIMLDLGEVMMMAEVIVNGKNLGVIWTKPYVVDITEAIERGTNQLAIRVTNTWWNRLVGDAKYPDGFPGSDHHAPRTFTTVKAWKGDDALMEAGLLGPVDIRAETK